MLQNMTFTKIFALSMILLIASLSCSTKKSVIYSARSIPENASIAVIIDSPNNIKNVVLVKFLAKGFNVKAVNASDLYTLNDIFDITDLKKLSYRTSGDASGSLSSMEKTYNNIYKLHVYNFELNKAEILNEIKTKWNVQYLVILDLKNWEKVSWGRVIDLRSYDIVWVENYPTEYHDNIETVVDHFIKGITGKK